MCVFRLLNINICPNISQSVRSRFGGTPSVLLLLGRPTRRRFTLFAAQRLSPPVFVSTDPLRICPHWVLSRVLGLSYCYPTPSLETLPLCLANAARYRTVCLKPRIYVVSTGQMWMSAVQRPRSTPLMRHRGRMFTHIPRRTRVEETNPEVWPAL